jgi:hypothetical protein
VLRATIISELNTSMEPSTDVPCHGIGPVVIPRAVR